MQTDALNHDPLSEGSEPNRRKRSRWGNVDEEDAKQEIQSEHVKPVEPPSKSAEQIAAAPTALVPTGEAKPKKSRWGGQASVAQTIDAQLAGLSEFEKARVKLEAVNQRLVNPMGLMDNRSSDQRSPSPEPVYDNRGIRLNTRQNRLRDKLIEERDKLLDEAQKLNPAFAPVGIARTKRQFTHRLPVPVNEYPEYNFMGLIIGPRGNTHRRMEQETGTKIAIRGKGATKKNKGKAYPHDDEDMHVMIIGDTQAAVDKAAKMIRELLVPVSEEHNVHKAAQLRELAAINGTVRSEVACRICGATGHKIHDCPERNGARWQPANVFCDTCGATTHLTKDCSTKVAGAPGAATTTVAAPGAAADTAGVTPSAPPVTVNAGIHDEYLSFMAELTGEKQPERVPEILPSKPRPQKVVESLVPAPRPQAAPAFNTAMMSPYAGAWPQSQWPQAWDPAAAAAAAAAGAYPGYAYPGADPYAQYQQYAAYAAQYYGYGQPGTDGAAAQYGQQPPTSDDVEFDMGTENGDAGPADSDPNGVPTGFVPVSHGPGLPPPAPGDDADTGE